MQSTQPFRFTSEHSGLQMGLSVPFGSHLFPMGPSVPFGSNLFPMGSSVPQQSPRQVFLQALEGKGEKSDLYSQLKPDLRLGVHELQQRTPTELYKSDDILSIYDNDPWSTWSAFDGIFPIITKPKIVVSNGQIGTDYTTTFAISILHQLVPNNVNCQAIVLTPCKESADKVFQVFMALSKNMPLLVAQHDIGGGFISYGEARSRYDSTQILILTVQALFNFVSSHTVATARTLVIHQVDRMTQRDFECIYKIRQEIYRRPQIMAFSSEWPSEQLLQLSKGLLNETSLKRGLEEIQQLFITVTEGEKFIILLGLLKLHSVTYGIIFCNEASSAKLLKSQLKSKNFAVSVIHKVLDHGARETYMKKFEDGKNIPQPLILISTDVKNGSNNIGAPVILNYDLPPSGKTYFTRLVSQCNGDPDRKITAINLVMPQEKELLKQIRDTYNFKITEVPRHGWLFQSGLEWLY